MNTNTNKKVQQNKALKRKALSLLARAIAKILLKFRLPRSDFINSLDEKLVLEAKKQDPEASNVTIAIRTGIDRRYIGKYLKGEMPHSKPDKLAVILEDIHWTAHKFYNSTKIPKTGPFRTFQSICEQRASGSLTYKAILEELVKNGNLEDHGNKVKLIHFKHNINKSELDYSTLTATQINRLATTLIFNSTKEHKVDMLVQRTVYSTQVNPEEYSQLHIEIEKLIQESYDKINSKIIDFESDVEVNTYPEYGISFLEYKSEE